MYSLNFNFFNTSILVAVIIELAFVLLLLFGKKQNQAANRFLALMLLIIAAWMFWTVSLGIGLNQYFPILNIIPFTFSLAMGPAIYFYVQKMCWPKQLLNKTVILHFIPVGIELIVHFANVWLSQQTGASFKSTFIFLSIYPLIQFASIISIATYIYFSFKHLKKFHYALKENYSDYVKYQLYWLKRLLIVFIAYELCWLPYTLVDYLIFDFKLSIESYYPLHMMISIIGIWLAVESFVNPDTKLVDLHQERDANQDENTPSIEEEMLTPQEQQTAIWLKQQMSEKRYYLDAELTLRTLADILDIHPNNLSRILNKGLKQSFADFINSYRVQEVIAQIDNESNATATLLEIAFDSGFNSKTTFNRIFKKFTQQTPLNYRKQKDKSTI